MDTEFVNLVYHFQGRWVHIPYMSYIEGCEVEHKIDIDFLSFTHMLKKYREELGMPNIIKLYYLMPGERLNDGLRVMEGDGNLNDLTKVIRGSVEKCSIHIYPFEDGEVGHLTTQSSVLENNSVVFNCSASNLSSWQVQGWVVGDRDGEIVQQVESDVDYILDFGDGNFERNAESESDGLSSDYERDDIHFDLINHSKRRVKYNVDDNNPHFVLGMSFGDACEARFAIAKYSVAKGTPLNLRPNEPKRIRARCKTEGCPFHLFISQDSKNEGLLVKRIDDQHTCLRDAKNPMASAKFLAKEFSQKIYENSKTSAKDLKYAAEKEMKLYVTKSKCKRVKKLVLNELDGSYKAEFAYLGAYVDKIKKTNPGTTAELELCEKSLNEGKFVFKRIYICFDALKRGWKAGCRPIIGLDGCHLKGIVKGQVLVAVGKDGADQIFPIAWAVASKENKENWIWFLQLLAVDLQIEDHGNNLTIVSDMQKGLVYAVSDVLPKVEHRYCARHVHANWSKKWNSGELKKRFWICVWSTYKEEFEDNLKHLGALSKHAAEDFVKYNPMTFCRAFFSSRSKCDIVDSNICESFNFTILEAREKPIVAMLIEIRVNAMKRLAANKLLVDKWTSEWSPKCMETYQDNMEAAFGCRVFFNGADGYEIVDGDDRHNVFLDKQLCTCRAWELSGIPCSHAICAIRHSKQDPKRFISHWYHKTTYEATYEVAIQPIPGKKFMDCDAFDKIQPPPVEAMPGRPRKVRIRGSSETMKGKTNGKLPKKGATMHCSICHSKEHNRATCLTKQSHTKRLVGLGLHIDEASGNMTLNPGLSSEKIITQKDPVASMLISRISDPVIKFPIPNERELRKEQQSSFLSKSSGTRRIAFVGDGSQSIIPQNLPFKPPGLKWKGKSSMTTNQLQQERDKKWAKKG